jgi:hypothetical protein
MMLQNPTFICTQFSLCVCLVTEQLMFDVTYSVYPLK